MKQSGELSPNLRPGPDAAFWRQAAAIRDAAPVPPWDEGERAALREFNAAAGASLETLTRIDALRDPQTLVVVGGQQAGLFVSPLYVLYKAIGAAQWARRLESLLDRPVLPVFWIASEDHDLEEIHRVRYLDREGRARSGTYEAADPAAGVSIGEIRADRAELSGFLDALRENTRPTEFRDDLFEQWRGIIESSETLEDFFAKGMTALLGSLEIVLVSPFLGPIRRRAAELMRREIASPGESSALLVKTAERMEREGGQPAIHRRGNEANFFLYRDGRRCKVTIENGRFDIAHPFTRETLDVTSREDLLEELERAPEHFSPNVAMRPLVQNHVLPVVAMVAGPAERTYLKMVDEAGLPAFFETVSPAILPRPEALLIEPRIERRLCRAGISVQDLQGDDWAQIEETLARTADDTGAIEGLDALRGEQKASFSRFADLLGPLREKPEIAAALEKTAGAASRALDKLETRVRETISREMEIAGAHRERVLEALRPEGAPQERALCPLAPFLINYGPRFVPHLVENLDPDREGIQVLFLSRI